MPSAGLLGGLSPRTFLARHWQKKPLLVRGALEHLDCTITPEELAGLACEAGVESRLVRRTQRSPYWQVRHGPFPEAVFRRLPAKHWTLLVQDVEKHLPGFETLMNAFRFIPDWRIDDLMINYATDGGSVGPHSDAYDVFLLQASGFRRWEISTGQHQESEAPDLPLKLIRDFRAEDSWLLAPGDLLYLPPGVAHHGVAVGDCMTYSIGFRAPSQQELVSDLSVVLADQASRTLHYRDPELQPARYRGELTVAGRKKIRDLVRSGFALDDEAVDVWFGCFITEPKAWLRPSPRKRRTTPSEVGMRLRSDGALEWYPSVRRAWFADARQAHLFIDGIHHALPLRLKGFVERLADSSRLGYDSLGPGSERARVLSLLAQCLDSGTLSWRR